MLVLAVAELGRVPLASVLFHRSRVMQAVALVGIVVLGYLAVENWTFGFERIVELRLKPVSAAGLLLSRAEAHQADLIRQRDQANTGESDKREELRRGIKDRVDTIKAEAETHQKNLEAIREACRVVREQCMVPRSKAEDQRYDAIRQRLTKERDDRQSELDELVKKDRGGVVSLDKDITAAASAVGDAGADWVCTHWRGDNRDCARRCAGRMNRPIGIGDDGIGFVANQRLCQLRHLLRRPVNGQIAALDKAACR
jgi:hypothetical protein